MHFGHKISRVSQSFWAAGDTHYICQQYTASIFLQRSRIIKPLPLTVIPHSTFATTQFRKTLQAHLRRWTGTNIAKFLNSKPEERHIFRNTHTFQGLVIVGTHVTHGGNNFQSCNVEGINKLISISPLVLL